MRSDRQLIENRRLIRMHHAFTLVRNHAASGGTITAGLHRIRSRRLRGPFHRYSLSTLWRLFARWRRDSRPGVLARNYKPGRKKVLSAEDLRDAIAYLRAHPSDTIKAACAALNRARTGSYRISVRALYRVLRHQLPMSWTEQRRRRIAAQATISRLDALLAEHLQPPHHDR